MCSFIRSAEIDGFGYALLINAAIRGLYSVPEMTLLQIQCFQPVVWMTGSNDEIADDLYQVSVANRRRDSQEFSP
jgi:hypothetical protein